MNLKHLFLAIAALAVSYTAEAQNNKSFADEHLSLSGYLQGGYSWDTGSNPETTFYLKRARISLTGNAPKEKFDYRLQVDMAGSPKICDLYFRYKPSPSFGMQLGQFKLPFAIENDIYGPTKVEFIDYSYITTFFARNNAEYDGIAATGRDIGFQIYGGFGDKKDYKTLSYNVGVFNGAGINVKDNNDAKDFVARIIFKPSKTLSFSGSVMTTTTSKVESELKVVPDLSNQDGIRIETATKTTDIESNRWAIGGIYDNKSLLIRSEYAKAEFGDTQLESFYAMGGYKFNGPWGVYARYEFLKHDHSNNDTRNLDRITLAGVYKPYDFLRIQINYSYTMTGRDANTTGLNLMVTTIF